MGEATVAACVVYDRMDMRRGEYRRYNIEGLTPGDDYAALNQAPRAPLRPHRERRGRRAGRDLHRRRQGAGRRGEGGPRRGRALRHRARRHREGSGAQARPRGALDRRSARCGCTPDHAGLHLIQQIRDEAHRFAIAGHRARRSKRRTTSSLEGICRSGREAPQAAADEVRRTEGGHGRERGGPDAGRGHQPQARREDLPGAPCRLTFRTC